MFIKVVQKLLLKVTSLKRLRENVIANFYIRGCFASLKVIHITKFYIIVSYTVDTAVEFRMLIDKSVINSFYAYQRLSFFLESLVSKLTNVQNRRVSLFKLNKRPILRSQNKHMIRMTSYH